MGRDTRIHLKDEPPKCMFSILGALNHHRWHSVKKVLPRRKHGGGQRQTAAGAPEDDKAYMDTEEEHEAKEDRCLIEDKPPELDAEKKEKATEQGSVNKSSMRSKIRNLFSEDMSRAKDRHRRTYSCPSPAQLKKTPPSTHPKSTDSDAELDMKDDTQKFTDDGSSKSDRGDVEESVDSNKMCELCAAKLSMTCWKRSEVDEEVRHSIQSDPRLQEDLVDSKQLMDALDVFGPRKDFFLKILQDPGSPLVHYLQNHQTFNSDMGLTKSLSFPMSGSVGRNMIEPTNNESKEEHRFHICDHSHNSVESRSAETIHKQSSSSMTKPHKDGTSIPNLGRPKSFNNLPSCSPRGLKIEHENTPVIKRFKNLRQKISHAIRESRKEKQQTITDSVFRKIPYYRKSPKVMKEDNSDQLSCDVDLSTASRQKQCDNECFRRAASFNNSLDKYSRLFECTFNRGAGHQNFETSRFRAENVPAPGKGTQKTLERLFSMPDLRSYSTLQMDGYPGPTRTPVKTYEKQASRIDTKRLSEETSCSVDQESQEQSEAPEHSATIEKSNEYSEVPNLDTAETTSHSQDTLQSTPRPEHLEQIPSDVSASNSEENITSISKLSMMEANSVPWQNNEINEPSRTADNQKADSSVKQWYDVFLHKQVDKKLFAEFNYVKDILELSGFNGHKLLGTWHSNGQPIDPSVFEEVESYPVNELESCENDEVRNCNHLLMFDLINEVLLEIHERSSSYYPTPLTCRSRINTMPVGNCVLKDVWTEIKWFLSWRPESYQSLDDAVGRDLARGDGWMNLQFDAECVGLELEDMISDDLLDEMLYDDLLEDFLWP